MIALVSFALHIVAAPIAIVDARIELGDGTALEKGTVVVDNGRIVALGASASVAVPAGAERIDGRNKVVTPGLIATGSQIGIVEVSLERQTVDAEVNDDVWGTSVPAFRAIDGYNPLSPRIPVDREQGITSVVVTPWGNLIHGQGFVVDTSGTLASVKAARRAAMFASLNGWGARAAGGGARGGVLLRLREIFDDVRFFQANRAAFDRAGARELSLPRVHLEAMIDVVAGRLPLVVRVDRASDIQALLAFAAEQKVRVIIDGGAEAWLLADDIAKAKVPVLVQPSTMEPRSFDALRARDDVAALLHKAGVVVVITAGATDNGTTRVRQEAGVAVSYGLPYAAAIEAITRAPARVFGADTGPNGVGSLAAGKRADLVLWSGDPLETSTWTELVLVNGVRMSLDTRQKQLAARYRRR
jgi:imidazolonepropionase-like amidohydrolase